MSATRRDVLAASIAVPALASALGEALAKGQLPPKLEPLPPPGTRYQLWRPKSHPHITLHQRVTGPYDENAAVEVVGVQIGGGPWIFHSDEEVQRHLQTMHDSHLINCEGLRRDYMEAARASLEYHRELGVDHDPALIVAFHKQRGEEHVAIYQEHIRDSIEKRRRDFGPSHPTLAKMLHAKIMAEQDAVIA